MSFVVPAVLPSSHSDLEEKLALFIHIPTLDRIQIDVVDGKFAQPASWPYTAPHELQNVLEKNQTLPHPERIAYEIDLMCVDAERVAEDWLALGATRLTFHAESVDHLPGLLAFVRARYGSGADFAAGLISFGVALNIESDLAIIEPCLDELDYVQFMGIADIGRQGQPFDDRVLEKVKTFHSAHPNIAIQVDGGVSLEQAKKLLALGVTNVVVGSAIVRAPSPVKAYAAFEDLKNFYGV